MATTVVPCGTRRSAAASAVGGRATAGSAVPVRRTSSAKSGPGSSPGVKNGMLTGWTLAARCAGPSRRGRSVAPAHGWPAERGSAAGLLAALLHVRADEVLRVGLQHLIDLVEEIVELRLDLLARLGLGWRLDHLFVGSGRGTL